LETKAVSFYISDTSKQALITGMITFDYFSLSLYFLVSTTMPFLPTAFSVILKPIVQTLF
jgi:hypothetical protein